MSLTREELLFLRSQGYGPGDVFDARNLPSDYWKARARDEGKAIVLGAPCRRAGHRLRTRAGHCVQCDTSKLAYHKRYSSPGYIYIAGSRSGRVVKIGMAIDIEQRERNLRNQSYGGISDWEILFHVPVEEGGRLEQAALSLVSRYIRTRTFEKDGALVDASEILSCPFSTALDAVRKVVGEESMSRSWKWSRSGEYEFNDVS
jgi:hypothetical protein